MIVFLLQFFIGNDAWRYKAQLGLNINVNDGKERSNDLTLNMDMCVC